MRARRMPHGAHVRPFSSVTQRSPRHASRTKNARMVSPPRKPLHADAILHARFLPERRLCVTLLDEYGLTNAKGRRPLSPFETYLPSSRKKLCTVLPRQFLKRLNTVVANSPSEASTGHKSVERRKRAIPETAKHAIPGHGCPSMQCPSEWLPKLRSRHGLNSNSASFAETP